MSLVFNVEEVLEIAVQIEKKGAAFYRRAADLVEDEIMAKMLQSLAVMEDGHEIGFENMRANPDILSQLIGDPDGDVALYLRAIASGLVFPEDESPADSLGEAVSMEEIFRTALEMEQSSIAFYQAIYDAMPENLGKAKVAEIIKEERRHVVLLTCELETLTE